MPARRLTPQEKKRPSYARDCRNRYGENDKSARRAIRRHKRHVNRTYRRATRQATHPADVEQIDDRVAAVMREYWIKCPDTPLGEVVAQKLERRRRMAGPRPEVVYRVLTAAELARESPELAPLIAELPPGITFTIGDATQRV